MVYDTPLTIITINVSNAYNITESLEIVRGLQIFRYIICFTLITYIMCWNLTTINMDMLKDWYTVAEAMVYSRLWRLAYSTDESDVLYPSEKQIAEDLYLSERWVRKALWNLERSWLIEIFQRWYKRRNNYYVCDLTNYPCKLDF